MGDNRSFLYMTLFHTSVVLYLVFVCKIVAAVRFDFNIGVVIHFVLSDCHGEVIQQHCHNGVFGSVYLQQMGSPGLDIQTQLKWI